MSQIDEKNRGSEWRKWDLHVHSPASYFWRGGKLFKDMNQTEKDAAMKEFIKTVNESDVAAFCVMDYWTFDWCIALRKYAKAHPSELKKPVFNGMELRVECPVDYRLNIHVILSDELSEQQLNDFRSELKIRIGKNTKNLSEEALISFAKSLGKDKAKVHGYTDTASLDESKLLELGSKTAEVTKDSLVAAFKHIPEDSGYILLPYDTSDGLLNLDWSQHPQDDNFFMQTASIFESRDRRNIDLFNGKKTEENKSFFENFYKTIGDCPKPCISGSDAHAFGEYGVYPSDRITWIKADPSFEGLKQIIYEPTLRAFIGSAAPSHSPNVIDSFSFKIPAGAKVGNDPFCFEGLEKKFYLNPYFNCFVGGRGTGKSTILNFFGLRSIHPDSSQTFWGGLDPQGFDPADDDIFQTEGTEIFEFLGQSEVEIFARDKVRFTQAIYDRANSRSGNELAQFEVSIEGYQSNLDTMIQNVLDLRRLEQQRQAAEKEKRTLEKGLSIASSEEYTALASEITEKTKELQSLREWRTKVDELRDSLEGLTLQEEEAEDSSDWWQEDEEETTPQVENADEQPSNQYVETYSKVYDEAIGKIGEISSLLAKEKFVAALREEEVLQKAIEDKEGQAKSILEKAGLSAENVAQIKSAPQKITVLEHQLTKFDEQIDAKKKAIKKYDVILEALQSTKQNYEQRLSEILQPLRDILEKQFTENEGRDIKKISLEYSFSEKAAWRAAAEEFYDRFKNDYGDGERSVEVCKFICEHQQAFGGDDLAAVQALLKGDTKAQKYLGFLGEIFKDEKNFKIFCCIRDKHLYDVKEYKLIQVKYGEKDIENASFGQRCTAVIVILLLFGNYPLIIDEPEAHLDSSLIANYLVPLLKSKKIDRQIIFATHNANFVVNGDAEKIFILEVPDKHTEFIESTIENLQHRESLLKLEGGEEAFLARKNKYHFN